MLLVLGGDPAARSHRVECEMDVSTRGQLTTPELGNSVGETNIRTTHMTTAGAISPQGNSRSARSTTEGTAKSGVDMTGCGRS